MYSKAEVISSAHVRSMLFGLRWCKDEPQRGQSASCSDGPRGGRETSWQQ
jgi:hypothetical protein